LELQRATEILKLRTIVSPIDGVVVERIASPGEAIGEQKTILMRLVQVNPLNVELIVPAEHFGKISSGDKLTVKTFGAVEGQFEAEIALIDPVIDGSSDTFGVRALLHNPEYKIPAGLPCFVALESLVKDDAGLANVSDL
jgi:multidrug efflux pump subunit AcrA (membrane-fusion protein)